MMSSLIHQDIQINEYICPFSLRPVLIVFIGHHAPRRGKIVRLMVSFQYPEERPATSAKTNRVPYMPNDIMSMMNGGQDHNPLSFPSFAPGHAERPCSPPVCSLFSQHSFSSPRSKRLPTKSWKSASPAHQPHQRTSFMTTFSVSLGNFTP